MPNFDRTVDNRWRPDLVSSQRRVREEEFEDALPDELEPRVIYSRQLSFVPARRRVFEPHDAQTVALIRQLAELERLPHGERVSKLLEHWKWLEAMTTPEEKQRWLEPLIATVRREPTENEHLVIFLMLVFEPVRRSVSKAFLAAHRGINAQPRDVSWANREEALMIRYVERERLYDVTREAALEAAFRYPAKAPPKFFPWLRETIAQRALDKLRGELPEALTSGGSVAEAEAIQNALAGFDQVDAPDMRERRGFGEWRARIRMRDVFDVVEHFFAHDPVSEACRVAVGRLPLAQREVIDSYFFKESEVSDIAERRKVSPSTIYNQKANAQGRLEGDDVFFSALYSLQRVRDRVRADELAAMYPDGVLPDGRRLVIIDNAA
jgi:DNA-directed RNA polymerase specialized sigma24 family protein